MGVAPAAGSGLQAWCRCGQWATPGVTYPEAVAALETEHGWSDPVCFICRRDYNRLVGGSRGFRRHLEVATVTDPLLAPDPDRPDRPDEFDGPGPERFVEVFICADLTECRPDPGSRPTASSVHAFVLAHLDPRRFRGLNPCQPPD